MTPTPEQLDMIRAYAVNLVLSRLPFCRNCSHPESTDHRANYDEVVTAGGYTFSAQNEATTCGYLCHWLLWMIGAIDKNIVNWNDPAHDLKYMPGANISKLRNNGQVPFISIMPPYAINQLEAGPLTAGPEPGDIIIINKQDDDTGYENNSDHVFVFLSNNPHDDLFADRDDIKASATPAGASGSPLIWVTGESGQGKPSTDAILKTRKVNLTGSTKSKTTIEDARSRTIIGWLSLSWLDYDGPTVAGICGGDDDGCL